MVRQEVVCDQYNSMTTSYTEVGDLIGITNIIKIPGTSFWKVLTRKKPTWCMFFLLFTSNDSTSQINLSLVSLKIIVYWMNTNQKQLKCISVYLHVDWFISEIVGKKITFFQDDIVLVTYLVYSKLNYFYYNQYLLIKWVNCI